MYEERSLLREKEEDYRRRFHLLCMYVYAQEGLYTNQKDTCIHPMLKKKYNARASKSPMVSIHSLFKVPETPSPVPPTIRKYGDASMMKRRPSTSADAVKKPTLCIHSASGSYNSYNIDKTHSCSRKCDRRRLQRQLRRRHRRSR